MHNNNFQRIYQVFNNIDDTVGKTPPYPIAMDDFIFMLIGSS
jgi:hypothetical protein